MTFIPNPDFDDQIRRQFEAVRAALDRVSDEYAGHPVDEVREALELAWNGVGNGASITEPDLTNVAERISAGKRVWLENDGSLMAED